MSVPGGCFVRTFRELGRESFNDERGRGCRKFVPVLKEDVPKIALPGDIFDQPPGEMN